MNTDSEQTKVATKAENIFQQGLDLVNQFVNKNYLIDVNKCDPVPMEDAKKSFMYLSFVQIDKIVYDRKENINDKLVSVYSALCNFGSSALMMLRSNAVGVQFYLGIRDEHRPSVARQILEKSLHGNFPGIHLRGLPMEEMKQILNDSFPDEYSSKAVASVSVVPSPRDQDKDKFVQGLEKFIDTMQGEEYTAIFISSPLGKDTLEDKKRGYEELYTALSQCAQLQLTYGENASVSVADGISKGFSHAVNDGISNTTGTNSGTNRSKGKSRNHGFSFGLFGTGFNMGSGTNVSRGSYSGTSQSYTDTHGETDTTSENTTQTQTQSQGVTGSLQITRKNKTVQELLENIDEQLKRIHSCESYGLWDSACYFVSGKEETAIVAANTYKALVSGETTNVENSFVNVWGDRFAESGKTMDILSYLRYGVHPRFTYHTEEADAGYEDQVITPASMISGLELPILMGLPHKSVNGVTSVNSAEFGRNVFSKNPNKPGRIIDLGAVYHMGVVFPKNRVHLNLDNLTSHCFICGSTGSGKSNTTYKIIDELIRPLNHVKFLVIEPAKGEYKKDFGNLKGINIFTTNPRFYTMLCINPFQFPEEIHVLEHLDRLIEIFSACWPLYAAMPSILKQAFERSYMRHGWDLNNSTWIDLGNGMWPTFRDICDILPKILDESAFAGEQKGNYIGSLVTRVQSLTNGLIGQIFGGVPVEDAALFDENTVVDLSRVGSAETKALIMGVLVLKLSEYRQANQTMTNARLQHVTIMEEAHNLLKRCSTEQGQDSANVQGKSVEMISASIAEMRTYGEGFLIVDQSPTAVDVSAIKNTNTKIVMNLPKAEDCEDVGHAMGLSDEQIRELSRLDKGVAAVFQNDWQEVVLTKIDKCSDEYVKQSIKEQDFDVRRELNGELVDELVREKQDGRFNQNWLNQVINDSHADGSYKSNLRARVQEFMNELKRDPSRQAVLYHKLMVEVMNCADLPEIFREFLPVGQFHKASEMTPSQVVSAKEWVRKVRKAIGRIGKEPGPKGYAVFFDEDTRDGAIRAVIDYEIDLHKKDALCCSYQAVMLLLTKPDYKPSKKKSSTGKPKAEVKNGAFHVHNATTWQQSHG